MLVQSFLRERAFAYIFEGMWDNGLLQWDICTSRKAFTDQEQRPGTPVAWIKLIGEEAFHF